MARIVFGKVCPVCGSSTLERVRRKEWMKWVPFSVYYRCDKCRGRLLTVGDFITFKVRSFS